MWGEKNNRAIKFLTARPNGILRGGVGSVNRYPFSVTFWHFINLLSLHGTSSSSFKPLLYNRNQTNKNDRIQFAGKSRDAHQKTSLNSI